MKIFDVIVINQIFINSLTPKLAWTGHTEYFTLSNARRLNILSMGNPWESMGWSSWQQHHWTMLQ